MSGAPKGVSGDVPLGASGVGGKKAESSADRWGRVKAAYIPSERVDDQDVCASRWTKLYGQFGATSDSDKDTAFTYVNAYFAKNGSSPIGGYKKSIIACGSSVPADSVQKLVGTREGAIRQFLRGKLYESVGCMRDSEVLRNDVEFTARGLEYGLSPEQCWLMADWIADANPYLTVDEADIASRIKAIKVSRAAKQRKGASVAVAGESRMRDATDVVEPAATESSAPANVGRLAF